MINKKLTPFKYCMLQTFPFIEATFDAIDNYGLLCKIVEYVNKNIIKTNELGIKVEELNNWFNSLDVQSEINNKLDEMAQDGTLYDIINNEIFGNITSELNLINSKVDTNNTILNKKVNINDSNILIIGDSYANGVTNGTNYTTSWVEFFKQNINNNNVIKIAENGSGFCSVGENGHTFLSLLRDSNIENKNDINYVIICGGINDISFNYDDINNNLINTINYIKENFPNAKIYIGMISNRKDMTVDGENARFLLMNKILRIYQYACLNGCYYLNGVEKIMKYKYFISDDNIHPTENGYRHLGSAIAQSLITGNVTWNFNDLKELQINNTNIIDNNLKFKCKFFNDIFYMSCDGGFITFNNLLNEKNGIIQLGNINDSEYFSRVIGNTFAVNLTAIITVQSLDGNNYACPVMFNIESNGNVYIRPYLWNIDGSGKIGFTGIKKIEFSAFNLSIPIMLT